MILETQRLVLRELVEDDAPFVLELVNGGPFRENIGDRGVRDLEGAKTYIAGLRESYARNGFGLWRAALRATDEPVGICGLVKRDSLPIPDVGYALLEPFWGKGLATEGAGGALEYGFTVLRLPVIAAITKPDNKGSIAVLEKIGMKYLGLRRLEGAEEDSTYFEAAA